MVLTASYRRWIVQNSLFSNHLKPLVIPISFLFFSRTAEGIRNENSHLILFFAGDQKWKRETVNNHLSMAACIKLSIIVWCTMAYSTAVRLYYRALSAHAGHPLLSCVVLHLSNPVAILWYNRCQSVKLLWNCAGGIDGSWTLPLFSLALAWLDTGTQWTGYPPSLERGI